MLIKLDLDGSGKIDFEEFLVAATDHKKLFTKESIQIAFNLFDFNKTGKIKISDFVKILPHNNINEKLTEHTISFNKKHEDPDKKERY